MEWRWWRLFWYQGMGGYSEADGYGNSKIWRQMRSGRKKWGVHQIWSRGFEQSGWWWVRSCWFWQVVYWDQWAEIQSWRSSELEDLPRTSCLPTLTLIATSHFRYSVQTKRNCVQYRHPVYAEPLNSISIRTHTRLTALCPVYPGEPVPER